jgi:hypothetical protein
LPTLICRILIIGPCRPSSGHRSPHTVTCLDDRKQSSLDLQTYWQRNKKSILHPIMHLLFAVLLALLYNEMTSKDVKSLRIN